MRLKNISAAIKIIRDAIDQKNKKSLLGGFDVLNNEPLRVFGYSEMSKLYKRSAQLPI